MGEDIAEKYLEGKGFTIVTRNYRKKFGEIDVVAKKDGRIHFVEVKTVSCEKLPESAKRESDSKNDLFRPEDNVHSWKLKRLSRVIQVYLSDKKIDDETDWQFDVITIFLDEKNKEAKVSVLSDLVL